jgi:streptogramin lyase
MGYEKQRNGILRCELWWVIVMAIYFSMNLVAADSVIRGAVTDDHGKPIRGAVVSASAKGKIVTRFSGPDGQYQITVPDGTYQVSAQAFGFAVKRQSKDSSQPGTVDLKLTPRFDITRLTGGQIETLLPDNQETRLIKAECIDCHNLATVLLRRGQTADEWKSFLPSMASDNIPDDMEQRFIKRKPEEIAALTQALEKYFGPDSPYFGPDAQRPDTSEIRRAPLADEVLRATIREYDLPKPRSFPHSIEIDTRSNVAWIADISVSANDVLKFDIPTESFKSYPMHTGSVYPHTGSVGRDGRFWVALANHHSDLGPHLASVDPETGEVKEYTFPGKVARAHTLRVDPVTGNLWFSGGRSGELWFFDVQKEQFKAYNYQVPNSWPEDSMAYYNRIPGEPLRPVNATSYDVYTDSKDTVWFSEMALGQLVHFDPKTGETAQYKAPGAFNIRGILVDPQDNVWFSSYHNHQLGTLDPKSGKIKYYEVPAADSSPYGFVYNPKTGQLWFADQNANNITSFDPKTGKFVEYPIPTTNANPRFISIDAEGRIWFTESMRSKIGVLDPGP